MNNYLKEYYDFLDKAVQYFGKALFDYEFKDYVLLISVQKPRLYGHFCSKNWNYESKHGEVKELNEIVIYAGYLVGRKLDESSSDYTISRTRTQIEVLTTLIHEMIHFKNSIHGVRDTVGGYGRNHNVFFKTVGEKCGLVFSGYDKKSGWSNATPNEKLEKMMLDFIEKNPVSFEKLHAKIKTPKPAVKTMFNYICDGCGVKIKAKAEAKLICGLCKSEFSRDKKEMEKDALKDLGLA